MGSERHENDLVRRYAARTAVRKVTGQVTAVNTSTKRCDVKLRAEAASTAGIPYVLDAAPAVNEYVLVEIEGTHIYRVIARLKLN
jgi:hypothetical protein